MTAVWVALLGAAGSLLRWAGGTALQRLLGARLPWGTWTVNVLGSAAIGVAMTWFNRRGLVDSPARFAVVAGFLGGFTTYSAFTWETWAMIDQRAFGLAALYVAGTVFVCLGACAAGAAVTARLMM